MSSTLDRAVSLQKAPLFAELAADALLPLANLSESMTLDSGEVLFAEGEVGDSLFIVVSGSLRVERSGRRITEMGPGECVGEMAALDWEARSATVVAREVSELIRIDRNDLMDILSDLPELVANLTLVLAKRIRQS